MTFEEYAVKNLHEMKTKEPTPQNMRDVALLELWLNQNAKEDLNLVKIVEKNKHKELLPAYFSYTDAKKRYQQKEVTKEKVVDLLGAALNEIQDLILLIYRNTDMLEEREILNAFLQKIKTI